MDDVQYGMNDVRYDMEVSCQKNADVDDVRAFTGTFIRNPSRTSFCYHSVPVEVGETTAISLFGVSCGKHGKPK